MVRFSCFSIPVENQKPKKGQHSGVAMQLNSRKSSQDQLAKFPSRFASSNPKIDGNNLSSTSAEQITSPSSHEGCWKSDDLNANFGPEGSKEVLQMLQIKKCQSLGNILDKEKGFSYGEATEDGFSFDYSHEKGMKRVNASLNHADSAEFFEHEHLERNFYSEHEENNGIESFDLIGDQMHNKSLFSIEVLKQFDVEQNADIDEQSADHVADSGGMSSDNFPIFARSRSVANLRIDSANATEDGPDPDWMGLRSRSFEHLHSLAEGRAELLSYDDDVTLHRHRPVSNSRNMLQASDMDVNGSPYHADLREEHLLSNKSDRSIEDPERDGKYWSEEFNFDSKPNEEQDFHNYNGSTNYAGEPENDVVIRKDLQQESPIQNWDELTPKELSMKRIEEWISQIDIENSIVQEVGESSNPSSEEPQNVTDVVTTKPDGRSNLGMEVAYNYISSLSVTSSSAQMANLGLAALPILSAFVSLRVLNLSGNSIVRITAGALPRGLHMLNLSKNNIATIEGLRDLTRLRVLDLSYNRIVRIGHGLASCSSLKELYLAGNKISEVEGLHRLLKLSILDLRLNKISTAKGLGQLAANYGSLQAINLEGNPAQRNIGDEQLKKYLLSLLPNLVYYNKHAIRASSSKEVADRPRDRGLRSEHKIPRRGSHGSGLHKLSSTHGRSGLGLASLLKQSKSKNVRLPPPVAKPTNLLPDISRKLLSLEPSYHIRRSRSEEQL